MTVDTRLQLKRRADWPERLEAFLLERLRVPFAWGSNDCCLFSADAVLAITGTDLAAEWRGTYDSARGALDVAASVDGGIRALVTRLLGNPIDSPVLAHRGDLVLFESEGRQVLGVVAGTGEWCAPGDSGLVFTSLAATVAVWRV